MARPIKKTVYERITAQQKKIKETEELLTKLNEELQQLNSEKDDLEMHQLLEAFKISNLNINDALIKLQS